MLFIMLQPSAFQLEITVFIVTAFGALLRRLSKYDSQYLSSAGFWLMSTGVAFL
jgi:hypothetical protein